MKRCSMCRQEKPATEFWRHSTARDGLHPSCRPCARANARRRWAKKPEAQRFFRRLRQRYGLTQAQAEELLAARGAQCWACGARPKSKNLHVDHDHRTGAVRGLLCLRCNVALSYIENTELHEQLLAYLRCPFGQALELLAA
jgi:hypothetical protein